MDPLIRAYLGVYEEKEFKFRPERQGPKPTSKPPSRERDIGKHDDWKDKPLEWGQRPPAAVKLKRRANAVVGTQEREDREVGLRREELEYILDVLVSEGFAVDYDGAVCILESMSDEWIDCILDEGNREEREWERKGMSSKDQAMAKARVRRHRFDTGTTHKNVGRENITWARPGTSGYSASIDRQRKDAHRMARRRKKNRPGTSPEDRKWADFAGDKPKGKYEKLQKSPSKSSQVSAQKNALIRRGERRRGLRTQAVNALRRTLGGGVVDN